MWDLKNLETMREGKTLPYSCRFGLRATYNNFEADDPGLENSNTPRRASTVALSVQLASVSICRSIHSAIVSNISTRTSESFRPERAGT